jgi:FkbH-like protein
MTMNMPSSVHSQVTAAIERANHLRGQGDLKGAVQAYLQAAERVETVPAALCLALARLYLQLNDIPELIRWATAVVDAGDDFRSWLSAATLIKNATAWKTSNPKRVARVAIAGSFTTAQLNALLPLAALRYGIQLEVWEGPYGQYRQELLDSQSALYSFRPDFILLAVHEGELALPSMSDNHERDVAQETTRWTSLWETAAVHSSARVMQFNFALPAEAPFGHLGRRLPGSRYAMTHAVNASLGVAAGTSVDIVDCDRLSALIGKEQWIDPRYWHLSKQAISMRALPLLARHVASVLAADLGLSRKCLVLDLDNTLWGGIIAEDGLEGIQLGGGVAGEAFVAFQDYIRQLKDKGVILAVCSKNNEADAKEPFERHPDMRLTLDDFAAFFANWDPKPDNLVRVAQSLNIGLDALVFADDNPIECAAVRRALPQVDVISLSGDPSYFARELSRYLLFETTSFTADDARRTEQYRARAHAARLEQSAGSVEELWTSLDMTASIAPFDELSLSRLVQLIGKTNQFNLTTRRHSQAQVEGFIQDPACIHFSVRLRDRFADHGLVALLIAKQNDSSVEIDTWLMSCRVIGRSLEKTMLAYLCQQAALRGITRIRGLYIPTVKNEPVKDLYSKLGFAQSGKLDTTEVWDYDVATRGPIENLFIKIVTLEDPNGDSPAVGAQQHTLSGPAI